MATMTHNISGAAVLRARLYEERDSLSKRIRALQPGVRVEQAADSMDEVQNQQDRDAAAGGLKRLRETAAEVECAIARWNLGVYGECIGCDGQIKTARLEAIPWAAHCTKCQDKKERQGR